MMVRTVFSLVFCLLAHATWGDKNVQCITIAKGEDGIAQTYLRVLGELDRFEEYFVGQEFNHWALVLPSQGRWQLVKLGDSVGESRVHFQAAMPGRENGLAGAWDSVVEKGIRPSTAVANVKFTPCLCSVANNFCLKPGMLAPVTDATSFITVTSSTPYTQVFSLPSPAYISAVFVPSVLPEVDLDGISVDGTSVSVQAKEGVVFLMQANEPELTVFRQTLNYDFSYQSRLLPAGSYSFTLAMQGNGNFTVPLDSPSSIQFQLFSQTKVSCTSWTPRMFVRSVAFAMLTGAEWVGQTVALSSENDVVLLTLLYHVVGDLSSPADGDFFTVTVLSLFSGQVLLTARQKASTGLVAFDVASLSKKVAKNVEHGVPSVVIVLGLEGRGSYAIEASDQDLYSTGQHEMIDPQSFLPINSTATEQTDIRLGVKVQHLAGQTIEPFCPLCFVNPPSASGTAVEVSCMLPGTLLSASPNQTQTTAPEPKPTGNFFLGTLKHEELYLILLGIASFILLLLVCYCAKKYKAVRVNNKETLESKLMEFQPM